MRIGTQPFAVDLLAVISQLLLAQPPFQKGAGIDSGRRMGLEEHQIPLPAPAVAAKEMIEAEFEDFCDRGVARNMAAEIAMRRIGVDDHRQGVPAHDRRDAFFKREIAGIVALLIGRDRIAVARIGYGWRVDPYRSA